MKTKRARGQNQTMRITYLRLTFCFPASLRAKKTVQSPKCLCSTTRFHPRDHPGYTIGRVGGQVIPADARRRKNYKRILLLHRTRK